ncbi:MAG TPA: murein biosynthesis integral membrane protein MurJ [Noviherbaspirillum sp.]|jgi:putative peptidoglycan lipid II flippase|uniref:murein biosynthesis integral membrane protein MurJ n=1 Tax=Noviherbaspirillum sp. TaxID=1926288 RepID=UPI002F935742
MNLHKTLATVSGMTMLSRVTGLLREVLIARAFGASAYTDAFIIAFRIPNLLRRLFAEGAFSQAFVPILAEYKTQKGDDATKELIDRVATVLVWAVLLTCIVGVAGAPVVVFLMASGLKEQPDTFAMATTMTRIMFPYIAFMAFVALAGGILNTWRQFKVPAFTPVLLNLSFIGASLLVAPHMEQPVYALALAVVVGGILQMALQVPALRRVGMLPRLGLNPRQALRDPGVQRVLRQMAPALFGVSVAQISLIINTNIASHLKTGSVSWLGYADRLMEFPTALLGVALGTILLPSLSKAHSAGDADEYSALLDWGLRLTFLLALPSAVGLAVLSEPLTAVLFHYGDKFAAYDVAMTARALVAYGVGLIGFILVKILAPAFYAKQDIRTPVKIAVGVLVVTQLLNIVLVPLVAHAGLALSIGIGACLNAVFLFFGLRRRGLYVARPGWTLFLVRLVAALFLLAGVAMWTAGHFDWLAMKSAPFVRIGALALVLGASGTVYFGALLLMGFRFRDFKRVSV